jgi:DNA-binding response OmpR family regulator
VEIAMEMCPHCGFDLTRVQPIQFGNIAITEREEIVFEGQRLWLTRCQYRIVESLVRAKGRQLTRGVLAERIGGDLNETTVTKYVERARQSFREINPSFDQLVSVRGFGAYRWEERCI